MSTTVRQPVPMTAAHPVWAVAAVEAPRMLRHPAFLLTFGLTMAFTFVLREGAPDWTGQEYWSSMVVWSFTWAGTFLAAALVAGRQRWLEDTELFPGVPARPGERVLGSVVALIGPIVLVALAVAALVWLSFPGGAALSEVPPGQLTNIPMLQWVQPVLLVALAGVLGVLVAQLPHGRWVGLVVGAALIWFTSSAIWMFGVSQASRVLHPFMFPAYERELPRGFSPSGWVPGDPPLRAPDEYNGRWRELILDTGTLAWHLGYVVGLAVLGTWAAMRLADDRDRHPRLLLVGGGLAVVCGVAQLVSALS